MKMIQKAEEYGNGWVKTSEADFWEKRLAIEVKEVLTLFSKMPCLNFDLSKGHIYNIKNELDDVINVCAMIWSNLERE